MYLISNQKSKPVFRFSPFWFVCRQCFKYTTLNLILAPRRKTNGSLKPAAFYISTILFCSFFHFFEAIEPNEDHADDPTNIMPLNSVFRISTSSDRVFMSKRKTGKELFDFIMYIDWYRAIDPVKLLFQPNCNQIFRKMNEWNEMKIK